MLWKFAANERLRVIMPDKSSIFCKKLDFCRQIGLTYLSILYNVSYSLTMPVSGSALLALTGMK